MKKYRKRGLLVNIILFIYTFNSILSIFVSLMNNKLKEIDSELALSNIHIICTLIISIITLIVIIGVIKWSRIAIYMFGAIAIFNYVVSFYVSDIETLSLILSTVMLGVVLFAVYSLLKKQI